MWKDRGEDEVKEKKKINWKALIGKPEFSTVLMLAVMIIITACLQSNFFAANTLLGYVNSFTPLILMAMGQAVVIISGGLDMSCGTSMALLLCIMTRIMDPAKPGTGVTALVVGLAAAVGIGLLNGFAVGYLRLPAVIATFATSYIWLGIALFVTPTPGGHQVAWFRGFYDLAQIPGFKGIGKTFPTAILWIVLACAIWFVIRRSRTGRYIYAVGKPIMRVRMPAGSTQEKFRRLPTLSTRCFCFLWQSTMPGQNGAGSANFGDTMTLQAVAAAVVGGVAMSGGRGQRLRGDRGRADYEFCRTHYLFCKYTQRIPDAGQRSDYYRSHRRIRRIRGLAEASGTERRWQIMDNRPGQTGKTSSQRLLQGK